MTTTNPYGVADLYDSDLSQSYSTFRPTITVFDNGDIDIDFSDCYVNSVDDGDNVESFEPNGEPHSTLLDRLVEGHGADPARALRRLADHIANHRRPEFPTADPSDDEAPEADDADDGLCPKCGWDSLQYADTDIRYWNMAGIAADGTVMFHGEFDWVGDGSDDHIVCSNCQAEWKVPARVQFI